MDKEKIGLFVGGLALGTVGLGILASKEAKKIYTCCTAAGLRAKECVLKKVTKIQVEAEDIVAEAKEMNEMRYGDSPQSTAVNKETEATVSEEK